MGTIYPHAAQKSRLGTGDLSTFFYISAWYSRDCGTENTESLQIRQDSTHTLLSMSTLVADKGAKPYLEGYRNYIFQKFGQNDSYLYLLYIQKIFSTSGGKLVI